jgi:alkylation response protein AidB-like acyl-CoA dehydrogenase
MHFGLTEEQELLQETVRGFVEGECPPPRLRELFDAGTGDDPALWKGQSEMGLAGLVVPEEHGGAGLEVLDLALVAEVLGEGALPGPFFGHSLACLAVAVGGSDAQRERWLPRLAAGDAVGSVALAEDSERWEPDDWSLAAEGGTLEGARLHVPHATRADVFVVGVAGGGLALVEKGASGLSVEAEAGIDRTRPLGRLAFDATPCELLLAADAAGRVRDAALVLLAADAFGAGWRLTRLTADYARERQQFGFPIAQFQAVKHQLADMATSIEQTRGLLWYAAHACDHMQEEAPRWAAMAKSHITDRATDIARAAVELHGGLGFTWECDVQFWFKRAMFDRAFLGAPAHHRERIAALGGW